MAKEERTKMQEALYKVLATMDIEKPNKVLIAMKLKEDKEIYDFLVWLKEEVPTEDLVKENEKQIVRKACDINRFYKAKLTINS